jgi:hypothetical protein
LELELIDSLLDFSLPPTECIGWIVCLDNLDMMLHGCIKESAMKNFPQKTTVIKEVSTSGQISLGKEYAGRKVLIERPSEGVWIIRTATVIPDNELWLHKKENQERLKKALAWATSTPVRFSDPDDLVPARTRARLRKTRLTRS